MRGFHRRSRRDGRARWFLILKGLVLTFREECDMMEESRGFGKKSAKIVLYWL